MNDSEFSSFFVVQTTSIAGTVVIVPKSVESSLSQRFFRETVKQKDFENGYCEHHWKFNLVADSQTTLVAAFIGSKWRQHDRQCMSHCNKCVGLLSVVIYLRREKYSTT